MTAVLAPWESCALLPAAPGTGPPQLRGACGPEPTTLAVEYSAIGIPDFEKSGTYAQSPATDCMLIS
jgi:hypothetical protein